MLELKLVSMKIWRSDLSRQHKNSKFSNYQSKSDSHEKNRASYIEALNFDKLARSHPVISATTLGRRVPICRGLVNAK